MTNTMEEWTVHHNHIQNYENPECAMKEALDPRGYSVQIQANQSMVFEVLIVVFLGRVEMGREVASEVLIMLFLNVCARDTGVLSVMFSYSGSLNGDGSASGQRTPLLWGKRPPFLSSSLLDQELSKIGHRPNKTCCLLF